MTCVLAVVGSTTWPDPSRLVVAEAVIIARIYQLQPALVVSGGAEGIDRLAVAVAKDMGVPYHEHLPRNRRWKPDGYEDRNRLIAQDCTHLLAIRSTASKTYGSGWTADRAEELGRIVERITL